MCLQEQSSHLKLIFHHFLFPVVLSLRPLLFQNSCGHFCHCFYHCHHCHCTPMTVLPPEVNVKGLIFYAICLLQASICLHFWATFNKKAPKAWLPYVSYIYSVFGRRAVTVFLPVIHFKNQILSVPRSGPKNKLSGRHWNQCSIQFYLSFSCYWSDLVGLYSFFVRLNSFPEDSSVSHLNRSLNRLCYQSSRHVCILC